MCPLCDADYVDATGIISHLETGGCSVARFTRKTLYGFLLAADPDSVFTKSKLDPPMNIQRRHRQNRRGWWECSICRREFYDWHDLNQHLNSPFHEQCLYHCPNDDECDREFTTLAGVFNHMQGGYCGYMSYNDVQKRMKSILSVFKALRRR